jgi:hypothetical protein
LLNPDILSSPQHKVVCFFSCSKRSALQCVHLCDMAPNEYTTNPSTSSAMCKACFPARRARAPHLAACRWSAGWAALAARLVEASRSLTAYCCSAGWAALAVCLVEASRSLAACCNSVDWVALVARMAATFVFLATCYGSAGCAAQAARMRAALAPRATCCCSAVC